MIAGSLPEADRREGEEVFAVHQDGLTTVPPLKVRAAVYAAISCACLGAEYCGAALSFQNLIGALPGDPPNLAVPALGFTSALAFTSVHAFLLAYPQSALGRWGQKALGFVGIGFAVASGLMLACLLSEATGHASPVLDGDLLGAATAPAEPSILTRLSGIAPVAFAAATGALTICTMFLTEMFVKKLRAALHEIHTLVTRGRQSRVLMDEINEGERQLADLRQKYAAAQRGLQPEAAYAHACELAATINDELSGAECYLSGHQLRKKPPQSVLPPRPGDETEVDLVALEKRVNAIRFSPKDIYHSFQRDDGGKKK